MSIFRVFGDSKAASNNGNPYSCHFYKCEVFFNIKALENIPPQHSRRTEIKGTSAVRCSQRSCHTQGLGFGWAGCKAAVIGLKVGVCLQLKFACRLHDQCCFYVIGTKIKRVSLYCLDTAHNLRRPLLSPPQKATKTIFLQQSVSINVRTFISSCISAWTQCWEHVYMHISRAHGWRIHSCPHNI